MDERHLLEEVSNTWFDVELHIKPLLSWVRESWQVGVDYYGNWETNPRVQTLEKIRTLEKAKKE